MLGEHQSMFSSEKSLLFGRLFSLPITISGQRAKPPSSSKSEYGLPDAFLPGKPLVRDLSSSVLGDK